MLAGGTVSTSRTSFSTFCNASGSLSGTIRARVGELLGANQPWIGGYEARRAPGPCALLAGSSTPAWRRSV